MKTLLLMRHAKSSWDDDVADHDRPLNARGERSAPQMAALLVGEKLQPDLILSSTALRARSTALSVAEAFAWKPEVRLMRSLYMADPAGILAEIASTPAAVGCLLVVGHNPGMEDLVSDLSLMRQAMPTAAVARFGVRAWSELGSTRPELVHVWRPREVD
ncbi:MAG: histidine phosphatase family protein [Myxococcales bacterium]|nr:histidine phosphatase family protein [Myxococcales bacterium]MCE7889874.1 histidine phosphatase family protein [Sorangiineae bacterium PRO1]MCL4749201.1 histidine phosphatase family protein [Myxococcales bacterium]